jgi:hypothetical protein
MWATARGHLLLGLFVRRFFDARYRTLRTTSVVEDFGQFGRAFRETDLAEADLGTIVHNLIFAGVQGPAAGHRLQHRRRVVPGCVRGNRLRCARQSLRCRHKAKRGCQAVHREACYPGCETPPGAVGTARTTGGGPQEGVKLGSTSRTGASILARDRRQNTRARHQG